MAIEARKGGIAAATAVSGAVHLAVFTALAVASLHRPAAAREIDRGVEDALRVVPVDVDAPLLRLGGERDGARPPERGVQPQTTPRAFERSPASAKAAKAERDAPPPDVKAEGVEAKASPREAGDAEQVDGRASALLDAGPPGAPGGPGAPDGVKEGTETDPLKARAVDLYRAKIAGWFSSRFGLHGSGIPAEQLVALRGRAVVQVGAGHVVTGYTLVPSGNAAFDAAARAALEGANGEALPPPPENYPDIEQTQINITFLCRANRCD